MGKFANTTSPIGAEWQSGELDPQSSSYHQAPINYGSQNWWADENVPGSTWSWWTEGPSDSQRRKYATAKAFTGAGHAYSPAGQFSEKMKQVGDKGLADIKYKGPAYGWDVGSAYMSDDGSFAYSPQGERIVGEDDAYSTETGVAKDVAMGQANYLGPSVTAQKTNELWKELYEEDAEKRMSRLQDGPHSSYWQETTEEGLEPGFTHEGLEAQLGTNDPRRLSADDLRKQLSSEFGAVDVSIGEGSTKDIKPFMHSDEAKAIQDITGAREAGLGTIPTEGTFAGSTPLDAMSGMETTFNRDWFAEQGENLSSDLFTGGGEGGAEPVVPSTFWSDAVSEELGSPGDMGGLVNQFLGKVNTASNVWADANQSLLEAQQAIGSKEREFGDLERSKGESAVETRAGLLGNVLDNMK